MKKIIGLLFCILILASASCLGITQNLEKDNNQLSTQDEDTWVERYYSEKDEQSRHIEFTSQDWGYIVAGESGSLFGPGETFQDYKLMKIDEMGNEIWSQTYDNHNGHDWCFSAKQTDDGGYIIVGGSSTYDTDQFDLYVIKTDILGSIEWEKTYGREGKQYGRSVIQTSDGGFLIAAQDVPDYPEWENFWLVKLDEYGYIEWDQEIGDEDYLERPYSVIQTNDGGYAILGYKKPDDQGNEWESYNIWFVKTDEWGYVEWDREYGEYGGEEGRDFKQTPDGGYIILGETLSIHGTQSYDMILIKTDESGEIEWVETYGDRGQETAGSVDLTNDGGYIIAGSFWIPDVNDRNSHMWMFKTDNRGAREWDHLYCEDLYGGIESAHQTPDGGYIAAATMIEYDSPFSGEGDCDIVVIKTDSDGDVESVSRAKDNSLSTNKFEKIFQKFPIFERFLYFLKNMITG